MARKVLIADDSLTVQKKASGILTGEGLEVVTVSNGVAALKKLPTVKPMVVLADVSMPGKDGYEVCEFVKNSAELGQVPVLLIFSDDDAYDEQKGAKVRADGKIKKPFDRDELIATVTKMVAQSEAAATKPSAPAVISAPPPKSSVVTEPVDLEPEIAAKEKIDLSSLQSEVAFPEPALDDFPTPPPEPPLAGEPMVEAEIHSEPAAEAEAVADEYSGAAETADAGEHPAVPAEPVLIEEHAAAPPPPSAPSTERTMMFRAPAEIAQPVLSDETTASPWAVESPPPAAESAPSGAAAHTLESFSLQDATTGQVRFAASGAEVAPATEPAVAQPTRGIDPAQVYSIVHKVVVKMSPPALSPQMIEDMAKRFAEEITDELSSQS